MRLTEHAELHISISCYSNGGTSISAAQSMTLTGLRSFLKRGNALHFSVGDFYAHRAIGIQFNEKVS